MTNYPVSIYIALSRVFYLSFQLNNLSPIALLCPLTAVRGLHASLTGFERGVGKEGVDSVGAVRKWSGERAKLNEGRHTQSCKLRNYGGKTMGINIKHKQDHKRNHVPKRVGRNVM